MKVYLIAGEASGDMHGANLMKAMLLLNPDLEFRFWGGDQMAAVGGKPVKHYKDLAFMGFVEVLFNLRTILSNLGDCKKDILDFHPDLIVLIDYPGFNLRIAKFAHSRGFKVAYYISPQVWAWKANRVHTIKKVVDRMITILPFESDFYRKYNMSVDYVGHPLLDALAPSEPTNKDAFIQRTGLSDKPIIAVMPGSRKQEVIAMLHVMLKVVPDFPDYQFVVAVVGNLDFSVYSHVPGWDQVAYVVDDATELLRASDAALVTSGTATLQAALLGVPEVVCYRGNPVSYAIARRIVDIKFISLVNLIMDRQVVKELIQSEMTVGNVKKELSLLLHNADIRARIDRDYKQLIELLGGVGASVRAAEIMLKIMES